MTIGSQETLLAAAWSANDDCHVKLDQADKLGQAIDFILQEIRKCTEPHGGIVQHELIPSNVMLIETLLSLQRDLLADAGAFVDKNFEALCDLRTQPPMSVAA